MNRGLHLWLVCLAACNDTFLTKVPKILPSTLASCENLAPPAGVVAAYSDGGVALSWQTQPLTFTSGLVERSQDGGPWVTLATVAAGDGVYNDSAVPNDATFLYRLSAIVGTCRSEPALSSELDAAPNAPTLTLSAASANALSLRWINNSAHATGFTLERKDAAAYEALVTLPASSTSFDDAPLAANRQYTYRLTVLGPQQRTTAVEASQWTWPIPPAALSASAASASRISLAWSDTDAGAWPFLVERGDGASFATIGITTATSFADDGLAANTTYTYRVSAVNLGGNGVSTPQSAMTFTLPAATLAGTASLDQSCTLAFPGNAVVDGRTTLQSTSGALSIANFAASASTATGFTTALTSAPTSDTPFTATWTASDAAGDTGAASTLAGTIHLTPWQRDALPGTSAGAAKNGAQPLVPALSASCTANCNGANASISLSPASFCYVTSDGRAFCSGDESHGLLGDGVNNGTVNDISYPQEVCASGTSSGGVCSGTALTAVTRVVGITASNTDLTAASEFRCAILSDKTVKCWGAYGAQVLGDGTFQTLPTDIGLTNVVDVAVGHAGGDGAFLCAVISDGSVKCAGTNHLGELGIGVPNTTTDHSATFVNAVCGPAASGCSGNLSHALSIAGTGSTVCALLDTHNVVCWGRNAATTMTAPTLVPCTAGDHCDATSHLDGAVQVSVGIGFQCALLENGEVRCWDGGSGSAALGCGSVSGGTNPVAVCDVGATATACGACSAKLSNVVALATADGFTLALLKDGGVRGWGGVPSDATGTSSAHLIPISLGVSGVVAITSSAQSACAERADHLIECWGTEHQGQFGHASNNGTGAYASAIMATSSAGTSVANTALLSCDQLSVSVP